MREISESIKRSSKVKTTNAERLKTYKVRMKGAGFKRLSIWVHPDLAAHLAAERAQGECMGRTLERLALGEARKRPHFPYGGGA
jgi:hypothetical protein